MGCFWKIYKDIYILIYWYVILKDLWRYNILISDLSNIKIVFEKFIKKYKYWYVIRLNWLVEYDILWIGINVLIREKGFDKFEMIFIFVIYICFGCI